MNIKVNEGEPLASIKNSKKYIGLVESNSGFKRINLKRKREGESDEVFSVMPNYKKRTKVFIAGPTGCGKTKFALDFMKNYQKLHPKNMIMIITSDPSDETIEKANIKHLKILDIEDPQLTDENEFLEPKMFRDCCVFIDDVDYMNDENLCKKFAKLTKDLLGMGRHHKTTVLISKHMIMDYKKTRFILSESDYVVVFPNCGSSYFTDSFFKTYFSKVNSHIKEEINKSNSRWVCCRMTYPQLIILEKSIILL